jgi:tetratricopeptide (TPR) repeat protein
MFALLILLQLAAPAASSGCTAAEGAAMRDAQVLLSRGDEANARVRLETVRAEPRCSTLQVAILSMRGWNQARALAPAGGAADLLGPVRETLDELQALGKIAAQPLEAEYAETCIRAAIAAAQDERPEMELLLTHARDLAERLVLRNLRAEWPRSYNLAAGELWFEVDRYEDARLAYDRAVRAEDSALALVGLARALARLERSDEACDTYSRVHDASPALRAAAARDLARCR